MFRVRPAEDERCPVTNGDHRKQAMCTISSAVMEIIHDIILLSRPYVFVTYLLENPLRLPFVVLSDRNLS